MPSINLNETAEQEVQELDQAQDAQEEAQKSVNLDAYASLLEDVEMGAEAIEAGDEDRGREWTYFTAAERAEAPMVVPITYRFPPEYLTKDALAKLEPRQRMLEMLHGSVDVLSRRTYYKAEFNRGAVTRYNEALPNGAQRMFYGSKFLPSNDPKDPIRWLSTLSKEYYEQNVQESRRPINGYSGAADTISGLNYVQLQVIDERGAVRKLEIYLDQVNSSKNSSVSDKLKVVEVIKGGREKPNDQLEFYGKPCVLSKTDKGYQFKALDESQMTDAQRERLAKGTASRDGNSKGFDDIFFYGIPAGSPIRKAVLNFMGLEQAHLAYLKEQGLV